MDVKAALNQIWNTEKRHAIIVAPVGAGKTFLAKDLACDTEKTVPIYVDLSSASGDYYIFSSILKEYAGIITGESDDITRRNALLKLFDSSRKAVPTYRLILDGIDEVDKSINPGLHKEINILSECCSLQIVMNACSLDYLNSSFFFEQLDSYSVLSLQLLPESQRDSILKKRGHSPADIAPQLLEVLRLPMFLSAFLNLESEDKEYRENMTSARDLFSAIVSRDIKVQACSDGLRKNAEYAFLFLLPALANELNKDRFSLEELKASLYKAYFATSYKCEAFDGISTDLIDKARRNAGNEVFIGFRSELSDKLFAEYVNKIFIPRGYIIQAETDQFCFSHHNWFLYFRSEHIHNTRSRYEEDPYLTEVPAIPGERPEINKGTQSPGDNPPRQKNQRTIFIIAAALLLAVCCGFGISRLTDKDDDVSIIVSDAVDNTLHSDLPKPEAEAGIAMSVPSVSASAPVSVPSVSDIKAIGADEEIQLPKGSSYLDEYITMYVDAPKGYSAYVYKGYDSASRKIGEAFQGSKVIVLARENDRFCVLYSTDKNVRTVGWINVDNLSTSFPGDSYYYGDANLSAQYSNTGDAVISWSKVPFPDTKILYTKIEELPLNSNSCRGMTIEYFVTHRGSSENYEREVFIDRGNGWESLGYLTISEKRAPVHFSIFFEVPTSVKAVAVIPTDPKSDDLGFRQTVVDILN